MYDVMFGTGDVSASNCVAYGAGLEEAFCNVAAEFTVELKDKLGNRVLRREDVAVALTHQASRLKVDACVQRQQDGTYQAVYTGEKQGDHMIEVLVGKGKAAIQASPFRITLSGI